MTDDRQPDWPERPALFLDLDGTLLEFAEEPAGVKVPDSVRRLLGKIQVSTGGATAVVSGRTMGDLDRLLAPHKFPLAAVHGLERRDSRGRIKRTAVDEDTFAALDGALRRYVEENPGTVLEHKGVTLALHYRKRPDLEAEVIREVESALGRVSTNLNPLLGNKVVEVRPAGQDKGSAITAFMSEDPFRGRTPVFIGDDATDEDGFLAVNALGGLSVKVNSGETAASARLPDIHAVLEWLEELVSRSLPGR